MKEAFKKYLETSNVGPQSPYYEEDLFEMFKAGVEYANLNLRKRARYLYNEAREAYNEIYPDVTPETLDINLGKMQALADLFGEENLRTPQIGDKVVVRRSPHIWRTVTGVEPDGSYILDHEIYGIKESDIQWVPGDYGQEYLKRGPEWDRIRRIYQECKEVVISDNPCLPGSEVDKAEAKLGILEVLFGEEPFRDLL